MNNKKMKLELTKTWAETFSESIAQETLRLVVGRAKNEPEGTEDLLVQSHIELVIMYTILYAIDMRHFEHMPKKELNKAVYEEFKKVRARIETSVGNAFTSAITKFDPERFEYYCQIRPSQDPVGTIQ